MKRHEDLPVAPPVLRAVTAPATGNEDGREPVALPVTVAPAVPGSAAVIPVAERAMSAVANAARELWLHPDRLIHSMWNGQPESMAGHYRYMTSRAWVPAELDGKKAAAVAFAGLAYHILIGWPLLAFSKALGAAATRPLRLLCLAVPVLILVLLFVL